MFIVYVYIYIYYIHNHIPGRRTGALSIAVFLLLLGEVAAAGRYSVVQKNLITALQATGGFSTGKMAGLILQGGAPHSYKLVYKP